MVDRGPRHLAFHPTLDIAYVVCEISSEIIALSYDSEKGTLTYIEGFEFNMLPKEYEGSPKVQAGADVMISADGKFLYATNRADPYGDGENSVVVFAIDLLNGSLNAI